jgi:hypothetical protein
MLRVCLRLVHAVLNSIIFETFPGVSGRFGDTTG